MNIFPTEGFEKRIYELPPEYSERFCIVRQLWRYFNKMPEFTATGEPLLESDIRIWLKPVSKKELKQNPNVWYKNGGDTNARRGHDFLGNVKYWVFLRKEEFVRLCSES